MAASPPKWPQRGRSRRERRSICEPPPAGQTVLRRLVRFGVEAQEEPLLRGDGDGNAAGKVVGGPRGGVAVRDRAAGGGVGEAVAAFRDVPFQEPRLRLPRAQVDEKQQLEVSAVDDLDVAEPRGGVSVSFEDGVPPRAARGEGVEERRDGVGRVGVEPDDVRGTSAAKRATAAALAGVA